MQLHHSVATAVVLIGLFSGCSSAPEPESASDPQAAIPTETPSSDDVIVGTITDHDPATGELVIETDSGETHRVQVRDHTTVHAIQDGHKEVGSGHRNLGKAIADGTVKGAHAVAHVAVTGANKTAHAVHIAEKETVKATKVTVHAIDHGARTVVMKTADGAEEVYHVSKMALVKTGKGIKKAGKATGDGIVEGSEVMAHYTLEGGRKTIHFFQHLGPHKPEPEI